jgi:rhamnose transport system substrate-binding protein
MIHKRFAFTALALIASACAAGVVASASGGGTNAHRKIALVRQPNNGFYDRVQSGAEMASTALGDQLIVEATNDPQVAISGLIAQHVDGIAVDPGYAGTDLTSALTKAKKAGVATVSYDRPSFGSGSTWIHPIGTTKYARALADALAVQMSHRGRYAVVPCSPADPIVTSWLKRVNAYVPKRYPQMKRIAVVYGDDSGNQHETAKFKHLIIHQRLRGLIVLCPTEAHVVPQAIIEAGKVGKVFAAGNGGGDDCPPLDSDLAAYVQQGAEQVVCSVDPAELGYLTVWAGNYLASGHTFKARRYDVGGPVGTVRYYRHGKELRLGRPLTITKANLAHYSG